MMFDDGAGEEALAYRTKGESEYIGRRSLNWKVEDSRPRAIKRRAGVGPFEFTSNGGGVPPKAGSPAEQKVVL